MSALPSDHPKMQAFQTALTSMLKQRLDKEEEKIKSANKEAEIAKRERILKQKLLLQAQAKLKQEELKAESALKELQEANIKRLAKERECKIEEEALEKCKLNLAQLLQERDKLKDKLNKVLEVQLILEARRVEAAGEAAASQTGLSKAQEDFKMLQERKRLQDIYVERMRRQAEELEQRAVEYQEQSTSLQKKTLELRATVREADLETEKVRKEKAEVVNKWSAEVINIAKRDQAIKLFSEALTAQELELKGLTCQISGTRREIVVCQERHDHLTTIEGRIERLCAARKSQIRQAVEMIDTTHEELEKASRAKQSTLKTLQATREELRALNKAIADRQAQVQALDLEDRRVQDKALLLLRDRETAAKGGDHAEAKIRNVRSEVDGLEAEASDTREKGARAEQEAAAVLTRLECEVKMEQDKIRRRTEDMGREEDRLRRGVERLRAEVDKKQNAVDVKVKEKAMLEESRERGTLCPLEAELARLRDDLHSTNSYCDQAKSSWLKMQGDLIDKTRRLQDSLSAARESGRRLEIVQAKRRKLDGELISMEEGMRGLERRIRVRGGVVGRLGGLLQQEKEKYDLALRALQTKQVQDNESLSNLQREMEELQSEVSGLTSEVETEKQSVLQAEAELREWEERVRACRTTREALRGGQGGLETLRGEVTLLRSRAEAAEREARVLACKMAEAVDRRGQMADRAERKQHQNEKVRNGRLKVLTAKKAEDLRLRLRRLCKDEEGLKLLLNKTKENGDEVKKGLDRNVAFLEKVRQMIKSTEHETSVARRERDRRLAAALRFQTRARWYQLARDRRYRVTTSIGKSEKDAQSEDSIIEDASTVAAQNEMLREALDRLGVDFPHLREQLVRIGDLM